MVIGDVHHHTGLAVEGLERIEMEFGRAVDQVFSLGNLGLFLDESDWEFPTGPTKYRQPEESPKIREAWKNWRWPLSMIAGNHEPFHRLRDWPPEYFQGKLEFTNAGELKHSLGGFRVAGLSKIFHPDELEFLTVLERRTMKLPPVKSWPEMVPLVRSGKISRSRLIYYKQTEIEQMKRLPFRPHLLLLHDWPSAPEHIAQVYERRSEAEIVAASKSPYVSVVDITLAFRFSTGGIPKSSP